MTKRKEMLIAELNKKVTELNKNVREKDARIAELERELKNARARSEVLENNIEQGRRLIVLNSNEHLLLNESLKAAKKRISDFIIDIHERGRIRAKHDPLYRMCREYILANHQDWRDIALRVSLKTQKYGINEILQVVEQMRGKEFTSQEQAEIFAEDANQRAKTWSASWGYKEGSTIEAIVTEGLVKELHVAEDEKALDGIDKAIEEDFTRG